MTLPLPFLRRRPEPRPVLVSVTNRYLCPAGEPVRRVCLVRLPSGELVERPIREERLIAAGIVSAAVAA